VISPVPIISVATTLLISNGTQLPTTVNFVPGNCVTYMQLPPRPPSMMGFAGTYNAQTISGEWFDMFNLAVPGGTVRVLQAAFSGSGQQRIEGSIGITVESQVFSGTVSFCCGPGCANQTPALTTVQTTTTVPTTTTPVTSPPPVTLPSGNCAVPFLPYSSVQPAACPSLFSCSFLVNNTCTPLVSAYARLVVSDGQLVDATPNTQPDPCRTSVALPNLTVTFRGSWTSQGIDGEWGTPFNLDSTVAPPPLSILTVVMSGSGRQSVRGIIGVTNPAVVSWSQEVCCGPGCDVVTTTVIPTTTVIQPTTVSTSASTTASTSASTVVSTTSPAPPRPCPNATDDTFTILINSILVNSVVTNDTGCNGASPPTVGTTVTSLVSGPTSGVLSLSPTGSFTFTPAFNSLASVSFVYRLCDSVQTLSCSTANVLINVIPGGSAPIARDDRFLVDSSTNFTRFGFVTTNDTSSSFNPAGPNQTPIPGNFLVSAPRSCSFAPASLPLNPCALANFGVVPSTGAFSFAIANPSGACPGNYSVVERCLEAGGSLTQCRPVCSISYGYLLSETAGPAQSSSATVTFVVVPPVAHVSVSVTSVLGPGPFVPGSNLTFSVRLFNAGPETATNIRVLVGIASGLSPVLNSSSPLPQWIVASLPVGGSAELLISTSVQSSPFSHVVTALITSLDEFDYSVLGHFALARVSVVPPVAPVAPNQTFSTTNSTCATLNVLG
jgi:hypothetical protein